MRVGQGEQRHVCPSPPPHARAQISLPTLYSSARSACGLLLQGLGLFWRCYSLCLPVSCMESGCFVMCGGCRVGCGFDRWIRWVSNDHAASQSGPESRLEQLVMYGAVAACACLLVALVAAQQAKHARSKHLYLKWEDIVFGDAPTVIGTGPMGDVLKGEYRGMAVAVKVRKGVGGLSACCCLQDAASEFRVVVVFRMVLLLMLKDVLTLMRNHLPTCKRDRSRRCVHSERVRLCARNQIIPSLWTVSPNNQPACAFLHAPVDMRLHCDRAGLCMV